MRPSLYKHPLAVLRKVIGYRQKEMAELIGCSAATVESIEIGPKRMRLSERLAERIEMETGVSIDWLLGEDPLIPIVDWKGRPYTRKTFEECRRLNQFGDREADDELLLRIWIKNCQLLGRLLLAGRAQHRTTLVSFRIEEGLRLIGRELKLLRPFEARGEFAEILGALQVFEETLKTGEQSLAFADLMSGLAAQVLGVPVINPRRPEMESPSPVGPAQPKTTSARPPRKQARGKTQK